MLTGPVRTACLIADRPRIPAVSTYAGSGGRSSAITISPPPGRAFPRTALLATTGLLRSVAFRHVRTGSTARQAQAFPYPHWIADAAGKVPRDSATGSACGDDQGLLRMITRGPAPPR